jgi:hypothetical protein
MVRKAPLGQTDTKRGIGPQDGRRHGHRHDRQLCQGQTRTGRAEMLNEGNAIALLALVAWPGIVALLFRTLPLERALIWSILGGYMWLPQISAINLPLIPAFDKTTIPNLSALLALVFATSRMPALWPDGWAARVLLAMFIASPVATVLGNLDPIVFGFDRVGTLMLFDTSALSREALPGLRIYDSISVLMRQVFVALPFFMAYRFLRTEEAVRDLLLALVLGGLLYALPMMFEARMSPQLHIIFYGFFQHDFLQSIRSDGFRPFVFMPHGLWVAFFSFSVLMATLALARCAPRKHRMRWVFVAIFMAGMLVLCRSVGPLLLALVFGPLILLAGRKLQLAVAVGVACIVLSYPVLRGAGVVPTGQLVSIVAERSAERAQSLGYRFDNEDLILSHVENRILFGWGGWGRFLPHDVRTGTTGVVADGEWIITIGHYGWLGYIAQFGLLTLPLFALWWHARRQGASIVPLPVAALALILSANLLDLLPNATLTPITWLMAGALLGYAEELSRARQRSGPARPRHLLGTMEPARAPVTRKGQRTVL